MKKVVIAGASGLIGRELIKIMLNHDTIAAVTVIVRRVLPVTHPKLMQIILDFDQLKDHMDEIAGDAVYCCLGTTKAKTPDLKEYWKIDHDFPVNLAELCAKKGFKQYHLISALGANKKSGIFYNKVKGHTEEDIKRIRFSSIHIYQPSLLTGERQEHRTGEKIAIGLMKFINPFLFGPLKRYQSIKAKTIAQAMLNQTIKELEGIHIYPSDKIKEFV